MQHVEARVDTAEACPLYRAGDAILFLGNVVQGVKGVPVCAIAVRHLLDAEQATAAGGGPGVLDLQFCGGCTGRAYFRVFPVREPDTAVLDRDSRRILDALRTMPLFAGVSSRQLKVILPAFQEHGFNDGDVLLAKGEPGRGLHVVLDGQVDILTVDDHGTEARLSTLGPGEAFGEMSLITGDRASATVRARGAVQTAAIGKDGFPEVLAHIPELHVNIARLLAQRLAKTGLWLVEEMKKGVMGNLDQVAPAELVQAINVNGQTGTLTARSEGRMLTLYFHEGQARQIDLDGVEGAEGFYAFLTWSRGQFRFDRTPRPEPPPHLYDTMGLLLEGMRRMDHAARGAAPAADADDQAMPEAR